MFPTPEQFQEYMELMKQDRAEAAAAARAHIQLIQQNAETASLAAEARHKEELERHRLESLANEARHKKYQEEMIAKFGDVFVNAGDDQRPSGQRLSTHDAKFDFVSTQFRKTQFKKYNPKDQNVNAWIQTVFDEVENIADNVHLNMTELTDSQKVQLIKTKLPSEVKAQLKVFCSRENKTFSTVTFARFRELLLKHCGIAINPVISLMKHFGPDRFVKDKDTLMVEHVLGFKDRLPSCLHPADDLVELKRFRDFIQRTAFYASIEDAEIRKSLIEIPEEKASYEEFTKIALERADQLHDNKTSQQVVQKVEIQPQVVESVMKVDGITYSRGSGHTSNRGYDGYHHYSQDKRGDYHQSNGRSDHPREAAPSSGF